MKIGTRIMIRDLRNTGKNNLGNSITDLGYVIELYGEK